MDLRAGRKEVECREQGEVMTDVGSRRGGRYGELHER